MDVGQIHAAFAARLGLNAALGIKGLAFDPDVEIQMAQLGHAVRGAGNFLAGAVIVETESLNAQIAAEPRRNAGLLGDEAVVMDVIPMTVELELRGVVVVVDRRLVADDAAIGEVGWAVTHHHLTSR